MKRKKILIPVFFSMLFIFAAIFALKEHRVFEANADDATAADPLNGMWQSRIVPKHRLMISYRGSDFDMKNFTATNETVSSGDWLMTNKTENVRTTSSSSIGASSSNYVFASASTEGQVPGTVTISPDFYGQTSFENVPRNVLVNSYLVKSGHLAFDIRSGDVLVGSTQVTDVSPAYQFKYRGDAIWHDAPALDKSTIHDIAAYDWNSDGYSDYAVTFVTADGGNNAESYACLLLVDGKTLWESCTGNHTMKASDSCKFINGSGSTLITGKNVVGGDTDVKPVTSIRMTKGDFDGDGTPEIAMFHTVIHGANAGEHRADMLEIYKIERAGISGYNITTMFSQDVGESLLPPDVVGIAAGDINNDGFDELVALYGRTDLFYQTSKVYMKVFKYDTGSKTIAALNSDHPDMEIASTYADIVNCSSAAPINAVIADLDGDGFSELVWSAVKDDSGKALHVWVHKWAVTNGSFVGSGDQYEYNMKTLITGHSWGINSTYMHHSLCTGLFNYPDTTSQTLTNVPQNIALAQQGGGNGTNNIDYGVFSWNKTNGLVCMGHEVFQNQLSDGNLGPVVSAVDINSESMILGKPQNFSVTDNIETVLIAQAPPKHWDRVLASGSALSADGDDGQTTMDAFSLFPKDGVATTTDGYFLALAADSAHKSSTSTTSTSKGSWGADASLTLNYRKNVLQKLYSAVTGTGSSSPMMSGGLKYSGSYAEKNTTAFTSSMTNSFSFEANRDDQLYYKSNGYELTRYAVLYPEKLRLTKVRNDETGEEVTAQNYMQFIVPQEVDTSLSPTNGRNITWYEPMHDNYNLFTYPRELKDIAGYPQGQEEKTKANANDPWLERNGCLFAKSVLNTSNPDQYNFGISVTDSGSKNAMTSLQQTVGGSLNLNPKLGSRLTAKIDLTGDYAWGTDSTTTTDASKMLSVKLYWPGTGAYTPYVKNIKSAEMAFDADFGYYSQDDGTIAMGFAIPALYSTGSMWGDTSPYAKHPDPGFNLPYRWDTAITTSSKLVENPDLQRRYTLRGLKFEKSVTGEETSVGNLQSGLGMRILEKNTSYDIGLRVINYSFVDASNVTVKYYYQPLDESSEDPTANYPVDNPASSSKCKLLTSQEINNIPGRKSKTDNWATSQIRVTTPNEVGLGYLHAVIDFGGKTELTAANDHGYALVGIYDPAVFTNINNFEVNSKNMTDPIEASARPDLMLVSLTAKELNDDGTTGDTVELNNAARYKKLAITATVKFTGGDIYIKGKRVTINHLPLIYTGLFSGKKYQTSLLAADGAPLLTSGEKREFTFNYDPFNPGYDKKNGVAVKIFSPLLPLSEQKNNANTMSVLWNKQGSSDSGNGGCMTGFGAAALLALVPLAWRKRKQQ